MTGRPGVTDPRGVGPGPTPELKKPLVRDPPPPGSAFKRSGFL